MSGPDAIDDAIAQAANTAPTMEQAAVRISADLTDAELLELTDAELLELVGWMTSTWAKTLEARRAAARHSGLIVPRRE